MAIQAYNPTNWEDSPSSETPISADNLNHIESGVKAVTDAVIALYNAGISPEGIAATITAAVATSLSEKLDKIANNKTNYIIVGANNGGVQASTYRITNDSSNMNPGATGYIPTAALVCNSTPRKAANLELETDKGYVTPRDVYRIIDAVFLDNDLRLVNGKLVYTDIDGTDHVLGE